MSDQAEDWWELDSDDGGGLAMNDGVTVCIKVLRGVLDHLNDRGDLVLLEDKDLVERLKPYGHSLGGHFARMNYDDRATFRRLRGVQGQTAGTMAAFESGLADWIERRKVNTNERARQINRVERAIQSHILEELKSEYHTDDDDWWFAGVPVSVRKKVNDRINEMGGGRREESFDFLHYEGIIQFHWNL